MARTFNQSSANYATATSAVAGYPVTLACRFRANSSVSAELCILRHSADGIPAFNLRTQAAGTIRATIRGATNRQAATTTATYGTTNFHVATGIYRSQTEKAVSLDGSALVTQNVDPGTVTLSEIDQAIIGNDGLDAGAIDGPPNADIDEVAWWNVELTIDEILALNWLPFGRIRSGALQQYWRLGLGGSPERNWAFGGGNAMTITGSLPVATGGPVGLLYPPRRSIVTFAPRYTQTKFRVYNDNGSGAI